MRAVGPVVRGRGRAPRGAPRRGYRHAPGRRARRGARGVRSPAGAQRAPQTAPRRGRRDDAALRIAGGAACADRRSGGAHRSAARCGRAGCERRTVARSGLLRAAGAPGADRRRRSRRCTRSMRPASSSNPTAASSICSRCSSASATRAAITGRRARVHGAVAQDSRVVQLDGNVRVAGVLPGSGETAQIDTQHLSVRHQRADRDDAGPGDHPHVRPSAPVARAWLRT